MANGLIRLLNGLEFRKFVGLLGINGNGDGNGDGDGNGNGHSKINEKVMKVAESE